MSSPTVTAERTKRFSMGASLAAALAASSCCIGPLLLGALGIGGAGAFAEASALRPIFLAVTAAFLGLGFYLSYRKVDDCGCERPKASKASRVVLWVATVSTVLVAAAPPLLAHVSPQPTPVVANTSAAVATLHVAGIDCEACAGPIRAALGEVAGFVDMRLDVPSKTVTITYEPGTGRPEAYAHAIDELGYESTLAAE